ncbi:hypothetical protein LSH36_264g04026 [Paralvinella palmiformis]|uniref:Uncharacterized protein n=1 Tax=Paralvinella palmiformis TaxID=53620 RepID=A0AAD9JLD3_9ANNE|nr:hypothetical protein LSH36_264g04026 [Paralvinella palmiformis]
MALFLLYALSVRLHLAIWQWALVDGQVEFELEGSGESYAAFPPWIPCRNGSLTLDFRTKKSSQLLLYLDTGQGEFFQVKLVRKVGMLRWSLGEGATSVLTAGHDLDDDVWHHAEIRREGGSTQFVIDNLERNAAENEADLDFGESAGIFYLYIGGLPLGQSSRELANRFTAYEPRFRGSIRNLRYSNCGALAENVDIIESEGLRETKDDPCKLINPCLHGGTCVATDMGAICDCTGSEHFGQFCEKDERKMEIASGMDNNPKLDQPRGQPRGQR